MTTGLLPRNAIRSDTKKKMIVLQLSQTSGAIASTRVSWNISVDTPAGSSASHSAYRPHAFLPTRREELRSWARRPRLPCCYERPLVIIQVPKQRNRASYRLALSHLIVNRFVNSPLEELVRLCQSCSQQRQSLCSAVSPPTTPHLAGGPPSFLALLHKGFPPTSLRNGNLFGVCRSLRQLSGSSSGASSQSTRVPTSRASRNDRAGIA
jgi:hypothetical protein